MVKQIPQGYKQTKVGIIPNEWKVEKIHKIFKKLSFPVEVCPESLYQEIGIRSHGKGIFYKEKVSGHDLGNKSVFWIHPNCLILNIVFAWEQAIAKTTENEIGFIASHRFPMYKPDQERVALDFYLYFFKSKRGKLSLELASPGGAGRNKTLGQLEFAELDVPLPPKKEQEKIAEILSTWDDAITKQEQLIAQKQVLKKGIMQQIFSQKIRFKKEHYSRYPKWKALFLKDILFEHRLKSDNACEVYSVSVNAGVVNQLQHLGRQYSASDTSKYNLAKPHDIIYTKSPTGSFPYGIVKQSLNCHNVIVSPLYAVYTPLNKNLGYILEAYFNSPIRAKNYLNSIVQKGAKNTISISNEIFISRYLTLPIDEEEQAKIAESLSCIEGEITKQTELLAQLKLQKQSLMQKLLTGQVRV